MLAVDNLTFGFRHRPLFADVSFRVQRGELVLLSGPNGAGKSTLISVVAGLLQPNKGTVQYFPTSTATPPDPKDAAEDRRAFLEYLPAEANGLFMKMDALQNLAFWVDLRGVAPDPTALKGALARWQLDHPLLSNGFPVEKFSTGMKRRLALARLSLTPAPCWLLDEPLYGLDTDAVAVFRAMLSDHLKMGGSALVVSHELSPFTGLVATTVPLGRGAGTGTTAPRGASA